MTECRVSGQSVGCGDSLRVCITAIFAPHADSNHVGPALFSENIAAPGFAGPSPDFAPAARARARRSFAVAGRRREPRRVAPRQCVTSSKVVRPAQPVSVCPATRGSLRPPLLTRLPAPAIYSPVSLQLRAPERGTESLGPGGSRRSGDPTRALRSTTRFRSNDWGACARTVLCTANLCAYECERVL